MKHGMWNGCWDQFVLYSTLLLLLSRTGASLWPEEEGARRSSLTREGVDPQMTVRDQPKPRRQSPPEGHRKQAHYYSHHQFYNPYSRESRPVPTSLRYSFPREKCSCNCNNNIGPEGVGAALCEWRVVFKAVAGNDRNVFNDFTNGGYINCYVPEAMAISSDLPYRDQDILDNWNSLFIKRVKIEVFAQGISKAWFIFNGIGTNLQRWMHEDRLIASSYDGIKEDNFVHFGVAGDDTEERRFFISTAETAACTTDCGYLLVVDTKTGERGCAYENGDTPFFLVSNTDQCATWTGADVVSGDRFVISARVCDMDW